MCTGKGTIFGTSACGYAGGRVFPTLTIHLQAYLFPRCLPPLRPSSPLPLAPPPPTHTHTPSLLCGRVLSSSVSIYAGGPLYNAFLLIHFKAKKIRSQIHEKRACSAPGERLKQDKGNVHKTSPKPGVAAEIVEIVTATNLSGERGLSMCVMTRIAHTQRD